MNKRKLWKPVLTLVLTAFAALYVLPTFLPEGSVPGWFPFKKRLSFGLDLQGGLELRYTVDYKKAISDNLLRTREQVIDAVVRAYATRDGKDPEVLADAEKAAYAQKFTVERTDFDTLSATFKDEADVALLTPDLVQELRSDLVRQAPSGNRVDLRMADQRIASIRDEVVNQTLDVIRKRVEAFGLVEPDVRKNGDTDIDIQMPGVKGAEVEQVRDRIGQTARLAFRIVDRGPDAVAFFKNQEAALATFQEKFPEKGRLLKLDRDATTGQWQLRADAGLVRGKGDSLAKNALYSFLKTIRVPDDHTVGFELVEQRDGNIVRERYHKTLYLWSRADVTGDHLTRAMVLFEQQGEPYVSLEFDNIGAKQFEEVTEKNTNEYMAIMLDDEVNSAPVIKERIGGGRAKITLGGNRHPREVLADAQSLVTVLTHGAYKAPVHKVHDAEVGPSLGKDTIDSGVLSLIISFAIVFVLMVAYYRMSGLLADIGLLLNVLFTLAILVGFNAALTMPGLAGIVLTVGMAVDANVLISERIREEMRLGKGPRACMEAGYDRAFSAIFDSNLTTAIAGIVLLNFASGPVYGFAVTMLIGIVCTFLTQLFVTRIMFEWYIERLRPERLQVGI
ncbi:MAG: protein translocase subunit SecD [Deltaproteobacteria bacterium]|nr:protein translocase subunit SecD [Deltaproteobacteria bacterium]